MITRTNYKEKKSATIQAYSEHISVTTPDIKAALKIVNTSLNHEINNALTPIFFISTYLKNNTSDPEIKVAMDMLLASATKIKETVANITELENNEDIQTTEYLNGIKMLDLQPKRAS